MREGRKREHSPQSSYYSNENSELNQDTISRKSNTFTDDIQLTNEAGCYDSRSFRSPKRTRRFGATLQRIRSDEVAMISTMQSDSQCMTPRCDADKNATNHKSGVVEVGKVAKHKEVSGKNKVCRIVRWKCNLCNSTALSESYVLYADGKVVRKEESPKINGKNCVPCDHKEKTLLYVYQA